jgi:hypothetical protein
MPGNEPSAEAVSDKAGDTTRPAVDWSTEAVPGTGRTMELLLEMQKNTPAERAAPEAVRKLAVPRPAAPSVQTEQALNLVAPAATLPPVGQATGQAANKPVLFGMNEEPAIRPSTGPEPSWQSAARSNNEGQRPRQGASQLPPWMHWPAEFAAWLRQNRYSVAAGALTTLLVVWLGSVVIGRRRYAG